MSDDSLIHVDAILSATLCAGIAHDIARLHGSQLTDEQLKSYHIQGMLDEFGSLRSIEQALSMMLSFDPQHNKAWLENIASILKSIYTVVARLTSEGAQDD